MMTLRLGKHLDKTEMDWIVLCYQLLRFYFFYQFLLEYSCFTMLCQFLAVQQSESVIHMHISTLFQISFPFRSPQSTEQSSLCCTVGSHQLSILYVVVCICQSQSPSSSHPSPPHLVTVKFVVAQILLFNKQKGSNNFRFGS